MGGTNQTVIQARQAFLGGTSRILLIGLNAESLIGNLPESVFCMHHLTFAVLAPP